MMSDNVITSLFTTMFNTYLKIQITGDSWIWKMSTFRHLKDLTWVDVFIKQIEQILCNEPSLASCNANNMWQLKIKNAQVQIFGRFYMGVVIKRVENFYTTRFP